VEVKWGDLLPESLGAMLVDRGNQLCQEGIALAKADVFEQKSKAGSNMLLRVEKT
jgi:hypothetical protein